MILVYANYALGWLQSTDAESPTPIFRIGEQSWCNPIPQYYLHTAHPACDQLQHHTMLCAQLGLLGRRWLCVYTVVQHQGGRPGQG